MFENMSWIHAFATAMLSYGGYPNPPLWYRRFTNTIFGKLMALTILIYQAGGRLDFIFSLSAAIIFYLLTEVTKRIHIFIRDNNDDYKKVCDTIADKLEISDDYHQNIGGIVVDPANTTYEERALKRAEL